MTATYKLRNLIAIEKLDLTLDGITLLVGPNRAGKTSAADGLRACLTGNPLVRGISAKTKLGPVTHNGAELAQALLKTEEGARQIQWPSGQVKTQGDPPTSSAMAVGLNPLSAMAMADRGAFLIDLLKAVPAQADLEKRFADNGLSEASAKKIWEIVSTDGWDGALRKVRDKMTKDKGVWEHITGERFGIKKAQEWHPANWDITLSDTAPDELEQIAQQARARVEELTGKHAVAAADIDRLREMADQVEHFRNNIGEWNSEISTIEEDLQEVLNARAELPAASTDRGIACPYPQCEGRRLRITQPGPAQRGLACVEDEQIDDEEQKKRLTAIASADGKIANLRAKLSQQQQSRDAAERKLTEAEEAAETLKGAGGGETLKLLETAKAELTAAEQNHQMAKAKQEADYKLRQIQHMQVAADALAPTGIRQDVMAKELKGFLSKRVKPLCKAGSFPEIAIDPTTLDISADDVPYYLLSRGMQHVVDTVLQTAIAAVDGSAMLVIDDIDKLDRVVRKGLFDMLAAAKIPALVCQAIALGGKVPDLQKAGLGRTVWLGSPSCDTEKT